jgi:pyrimidine nucleoside transport protein
VLWGVALQFVFGLVILRWSVGKEIFTCFGDKVSIFLQFTDNGTVFIFDYLVSGQLQGNFGGDSVFQNVTLPQQSPIFAFKVYNQDF